MTVDLHFRKILVALSLVLTGIACAPARGSPGTAATPEPRPADKYLQASACHLDGSTADWIRGIYRSWLAGSVRCGIETAMISAEGISEPDELRRVWVRRTDDTGVHESDRFA